ncbi:MAG: YbjN domain-containing protein [Thermoplasmata archaeon]|nr:YbjN domain-containing protein [Thermoplasmata archaeon]
MFGKPDGAKAIKNAMKALDNLELVYDVNEGRIVLSAMGDDLPIGMVIMADDDNMTLNIYCYLMFDIPDDARRRLVQELNTLNNTINNGGFYMADEENKIYFKIVQSYYDQVPSVDTIAHLIGISFKTVDINDGKLHGLIPADAVRKDLMYS